MVDVRASFTGSIPEYYDRCLGPAWFEAYADDLAARIPQRPPGAVLEIACGTGLLSKRLRQRLDPSVRLVASDLSKAMLDYAQGKARDFPGIDWREADGTKLPFADGEFAAVACGFGIMFMPDRAQALREMRRVLAEGGVLAFNVWGGLDDNPHGKANIVAMQKLFPGDAEMAFTLPYDMADPALLRELLAAARFREVRIEPKQVRIRAAARTIAEGQVRGTPRGLLVEKRGVPLDAAIDACVTELARVGGDPYDGPATALVVEARAI